MIGTPARGVTPRPAAAPPSPPSQAGSPGKGQLVLGGVWSSHWNGGRWPQGWVVGIALLPLHLSPLPTKTEDKASLGKAGSLQHAAFCLSIKNKQKIIYEKNPPAAAARLLHAGSSAGFAQRKGICGLRNQIHVGCEKMLPRGPRTPPKAPSPSGGERSSFAQPAAVQL